MSHRLSGAFLSVVLFGCCAVMSSCGGASGSTASTEPKSAAMPSAQATAPEKPEPPFLPPTVSIGSDTKVAAADLEQADDDARALAALAEPDKGTPEWLIREITRLNSAPINVVQQPVAGKPNEFTEVRLTDEQALAEQKRRAEQIVELALEACTKTKSATEKEQIFNNSVHYLALARTTLALEGDTDQVNLLGDEVETLFKRNARSFAAIDAHIKLVELLQLLAEQSGRREPKWGQAAARHARLFAGRFPQDTSRAALALLTAARACESSGQFDEARECFAMIESSFGKTAFAEQAAGSLRRYKLTGRPLEEFAGATIDGGYLSIDQYRGQTIVIAFWSAASPSFQEDLPRIRKAISPFAANSLTLVGVNLDIDESIVDSYLESVDLPWRTIFFANPDQRGLRNPIARFYGVTTVPQYWIVDSKGSVVAAPTDIAGLETHLKTLSSSSKR
jgi:hypothetical protein